MNVKNWHQRLVVDGRDSTWYSTWVAGHSNPELVRKNSEPGRSLGTVLGLSLGVALGLSLSRALKRFVEAKETDGLVGLGLSDCWSA